MARKELLYGLLQSLPILALVNADFNWTSLDSCIDFDLAQVEEYTSTLNFTPSLELNFTSSSKDDRANVQPFGAFENDWFRLHLLYDALPEDSILKKRFKHIFRLLLIAHDQAAKSQHSTGIQQEFQDTITKATTESYFIEETSYTQEIYKQTPLVESDEHLISISPSQEDPKDGVDSATMRNSSESTMLDYEEEITTASIIPDTENVLVKSSKIVEDSISTVEMSDFLSNTSLDTQINVTATKILTESRETSSYKKTTIPISRTMPDEDIISTSNHENVSFVSSEFVTIGSILQPTTIEKVTNSSDRESQEIFGITSSNLTSETGPILKGEFEQSSSAGTISNLPLTKIQSLLTTPSQQLLTSTKMTAGNTSWALSSTMKNPMKYFTTSESLESTTTERMPISTMVTAENSSGLQSSIIRTDLTTQPLTLEEHSSAGKYINSPSTKSISMTTPSKVVSTTRDGNLEESSQRPFFTPKEYSSGETIINSTTTQSVSTTTSSEQFSISTNRKLEKTSWTPFLSPNKYSSKEIIVYPTPTDGQSRITTLSEDNSELTKQADEKTLWTSSSTTTDPNEEFTNTESPIWINNATLPFSEELLLNETQTQSTLEVDDSSNSLNSQIQESLTTSISVSRVTSSEDSIKTMISSTKNDEIKTTSYDDRTEILMPKLTDNKSIDFTSTAIFTTSSDLVEQTTQTRTDFTEETTTYFAEPSTIITSSKKSTEASSDSKYTNNWETSKSEILTNNITSDSSKDKTESITESTDKDSSTIVGKIETSSYWKTSTVQARPSYVKNPLYHSSSGNNIFRDYKHDSNDTVNERNGESPQIVLYESGAGSRNRSVWRPHLARQPPAGNNIRRFDTFPKNNNLNEHQRPSTSMETTNAASHHQESENLTKWPFHGRKNILRSRKRGSANGNIEKEFIWFYRQAGQSEDGNKSRDMKNDDAKIKIQCNN